ncbi:SDR family NAD(P)-dependent oxidoreductase [Bryobacter aggregatus]|uniref:SDR family NAD(P)-dependent oxidoreductase n=1 Tax=Bryobacter aggregatus TaxID=360054 RepID=UPI0004E13FB9|nr:SDR family NAD(P)-dependent oxidoreductase [Bryobacter aggregatus]
MTLAGRTAIVTGGASGLGEACVRALAAAQCTVVIADLNEEKGTALAHELGALTQFCRTDVCDEADVLAALDEGERLDIAINCAGIATAERTLGKDGPLDLERFERVLRINLLGTFNVTRLAAAMMAKNEPGPDGERGVIVNTSSVAAFDGQIGQAAYAASKGAVAAMTLPLAREFARIGIRVLAIAPGLFHTPLLAGLPEEAMKQLAATVPFPARLGEPSEFASLALHLVQNRMMNGEVVRLDGALRMAPR